MLSIHVYRWAVRHGDARDLVEQAVLLNLADHAGKDDGRDAFPSVPTIASEIRGGEDAVRRAIKRLLKNGCIRQDGWRGSGGQKVKNYTVITPWTPKPHRGRSELRVAGRARPLAVSEGTPSSERPEQPENNHRSAEGARARKPPSLDAVEQVLRDALPLLPDGRLHINGAKVAQVLTDFPGLSEEHVRGAHYVVMRAFGDGIDKTPEAKLHADRLLWLYLRNSRQIQLFEADE